ncbi:MAG: hypothetical protein K6G10_01275 [Butyrivibrio sp.]|nr:hypothetical protein [Butyrivibrio sp.]
MRENRIKITLLKIAYFILVLFVSIIVVSKLTQSDNTDMTAPMPKATLPVVSLSSGDIKINPMHGYLDQMDVNYIRGDVFPVGSGRNVSFIVDTYDTAVSKVSFEVRSIDGKSLVESTEIEDYKETDSAITGSFQLKDLIAAGKEYMLVMLLYTPQGTARYYNRVVWTEDEDRYHIQDELDFVKGFHEATFSKTAAQEYSKYLESNSEGDNTTFSKVNIHSSFKQVTWGDLNISRHTDPEISVTDIHGQTGSYKLRYRVYVKDGTITRPYNVVEAYRVRFTTDRMYLLNFERTMNYIFDASSYSLGTNTIAMGISDPDIQLVESDSGSAFAFVSENRLFMFDNTEGRLAYIFGFYDTDNDDSRTCNDNHSIKILKVDEAGNVRFAVCGYMNRGIHEGCVGISVFDYNASLNAVEEMVFVRSSQSGEILREYAGTLAYASSSDIFYVMLDQNIYAIDLVGKTANLVVDNIGAGEYKISGSEKIISWQSEDLKSLNIMNLSSRAVSEIKASAGEVIILQGFMGDDLVYGEVNTSDIRNDSMGNPVYAMHAVKIVDADGNTLENYHPDGVYVTAMAIGDNQIKLTRVVKDEENDNYTATYDDQIMSTLKAENGSNVVSQVSVDVFEKIVQIVTKSDIKTKKLRVLTPNQTLYEGDRTAEPEIERDPKEKPFYYVYGLMGMEGIYSDPADAVLVANKAPGTVVGDDNSYVWIKGNLLRSNQIMSITRNAEVYDDMTSQDTTAVCLDMMLQFEGVNRNVEAMLQSGNTVGQILSSSLPEAKVLDLDGCPLSAMLYYVNQDLPVMAILNDGSSMLVIGFNDQNTVLLNPQTGSVYKYGMNDSTKLFEENGNHFITYIRNNSL